MTGDGILRKIGPHIWRGTLNRYKVDVFLIRDLWHYSIGHPDHFTCICTRCESFADGAAKATKWLERTPLPKE
jgi:hypothetical protein